MSTADKRLNKPGCFLTHRSQVGAAAADSATINDTNFPPTDAFRGDGCDSIWIYWTGTGGGGADTIDVIPLIRDGINDLWTVRPKITLKVRELTEYTIRGACNIYLRIDSVAATTATALRIRVAQGLAEKVQ